MYWTRFLNVVIVVFCLLSGTVAHKSQANLPQPRPLTNDDAMALYSEWSPDGKRIVYCSTVDGDRDIYVMDADGSNRQKLTDDEHQDYFPSWSPDGTRIAYVSQIDDERDIWVLDIDTGNRQRVGFEGSEENNPLWMDDGSRLLFASDRDGDFELYSVLSDGTDLHSLTSNRYYDQPLDIFPNGDILYRTYENGETKLFIHNEGAGYTIPLPFDAGEPFSSSWSPDGMQIVITTGDDEQLDLYILDVVSGETIQLTDTADMHEYYPSWSPDGKQIVFSHKDGQTGITELYVIDVSNYSTQQEDVLNDLMNDPILQTLMTPGTLTGSADDENGFMYTLPSEEPFPDVELIQAITFYPETQQGRIALILLSEGEEYNYSRIVDIPKSFAEHVDDLLFLDPPDEIIDPDPVVLFNISSDENGRGLALIESQRVHADGQDLNSVMNVFLDFQYLRMKRKCDEKSITARSNVRNAADEQLNCYLMTAMAFPNNIDESHCDQMASFVDTLGRDERLYLTCRAILTRDPWECSRITLERDYEPEHLDDCLGMYSRSIEYSCRYLTGAAEKACLAEARVDQNTVSQPVSTNPPPAASNSDGIKTGWWARQYERTGSLWDNAVEQLEDVVRVDTCDDGTISYSVRAPNVCLQQFRHYEVAPGVYERPLFSDGDTGDVIGFTRLTVVSPTVIEYYSESLQNDYSSYSDGVMRWQSD